jgi:hypothetical protein
VRRTNGQDAVLGEKNEVDIELALVTMALLADDEVAAIQLKEHHGITTTAARLAVIRRRFVERSEGPRRRRRPARESAHQRLCDNAKLAGVAVQLAIKRTLELLASGRCQDPLKVGRDLADVQAKAIDESRLVQDKPTVIVAKPKIAAIISGLESLEGLETDPEEVSGARRPTA